MRGSLAQRAAREKARKARLAKQELEKRKNAPPPSDSINAEMQAEDEVKTGGYHLRRHSVRICYNEAPAPRTSTEATKKNRAEALKKAKEKCKPYEKKKALHERLSNFSKMRFSK